MKDRILQDHIIRELGVKPVIDVAEEVVHRVNFLDDYLRKSGATGYVLGISGGIDSTVAGRLAQMAVEQLRSRHPVDAKFHAVRLPYGAQRDEADAQKALRFIRADEELEVNIKSPSDEMLRRIPVHYRDNAHEDFVFGNIKARQRMIAQYAIAGAMNALVIGTDHASEAVMGFFTKFGDGAADICPLAGLTKDQVREIGAYLGVPEELVSKQPTADLEDLNPGKPDEEAFGFPYDHVNMYLKGEEIPEESEEKLVKAYTNTVHKRNQPVTPGPSIFD